MKTNSDALVVILGLSDSQERYSNMAYGKLKACDFNNLVGISPKQLQISDIPVYKELSEIDQPVDTLTVYVNPTVLNSLKDEIVKLKPRRVIFNPGSDDDETEELLIKEGIEAVHGCTLVMLSINNF